MIKFKLFLLTPQFANNTVKYCADMFGSFQHQIGEYKNNQLLRYINPAEKTAVEVNKHWEDYENSFSYSYNEKVKKSLNAQSELTFSMNKKMFISGEWRENPFSRNIIIGSRILLREYITNKTYVDSLFTVREIKYEIKENNIVYGVTCADSFTYQNSRQNAGYTVENDKDSENFIGARDVDWWIINKIIPECHLHYRYLSLAEGLYRRQNGKVGTFTYAEKSILASKATDIQAIIKEPYSGIEDFDLYTKVTFSCDNANAGEALINLASMLNLQVQKYEEFDGDDIATYFWLEPKQNTERAGLLYSPYSDVKTFELSHKGDSLTTVLNVTGTQVAEEQVTLFPTLPMFFARLFNDPYWLKTKFYPGMFTDLCMGKTYSTNSFETHDIDFQAWVTPVGADNSIQTTIDGHSGDKTAYVLEHIIPNDVAGAFYFKDGIGYTFNDATWQYIPITTSGAFFDFPPLYESFNFIKDDSISSISLISDGQTILLTANTTFWELVVFDETTSITTVYRAGEKINLMPNHNYRFFVRILLPSGLGSSFSWDEPEIFIFFNRDYTQEELDFAQVADECPWLENKIIDFSYFLENKLITPHEYSSLMNRLLNDMRIINGRLMFFGKAYYRALHAQTEHIAKLNERIERIGAEVQVLIDQSTQHGVITQEEFLNYKGQCDVYKTYFSKEGKRTPLLNYNQFLEKYFKDSFTMEQRFLKNIKSFKDYFTAPVQISQKGLYRFTFEIDPSLSFPTEDLTVYSFYTFSSHNGLFNQVDEDFSLYSGFNEDGDNLDDPMYGKPLVGLFQGTSSGFTPLTVVSKENYKDFLVPNIKAGSLSFTDTNEKRKHRLDRKYYQKVVDLPVTKQNDKFYLTTQGGPREVVLTSSPITAPSSTDPWNSLYSINSNGRKFYFAGKRFKMVENEGTEDYYLVLVPVLNVDHNEFTAIDEIYLCTLDLNGLPTEFVEVASSLVETRYEIISNTDIYNNYLATCILFDDNFSFTKRVEAFSNDYFVSGNDLGNSLSWDILVYIIGSEEEINHFATLNTGSERAEEVYRLYKKYFPIHNFYYYGAKYKAKILEKDESVYFYRENAKGQHQGDYINFLLGKTDHIIENPFNYKEYQSIPFVTHANEKNFYRRATLTKKQATWTGIATNVGGTLLLGPLVGTAVGNLIYYFIKHGSSSLKREGFSSRELFNPENTLPPENRFYGFSDQNRPLYAKNVDSYEIKTKITSTYIDYDSTQTKTISSWDDEYANYIISSIVKNANTVTISGKASSEDVNFLIKYGEIGSTYEYARNEGLKFKTAYLRPLSLDEKVRKDAIYKVYLDEENLISDYETNPFDSFPFKLSSVKYYPLFALLSGVETKEVDWSKEPTLKELLEDTGYTNVTKETSPALDYLINVTTPDQSSVTKRIIVFEFQDYDIEVYGSNNDTKNKFLTKYPFDIHSLSNRVYDSNNISFDFQKRGGVVKGYYIYNDKDQDFVQPETFDLNEIYYFSNKKERAYTLKQVLKEKPLTAYYLNAFTYHQDYLDESPENFTVSVFRNQADMTKINDKLYLQNIKLEEELRFNQVDVESIWEQDGSKTAVIKVEQDNQILSIPLTITRETLWADLQTLDNGSFWYSFKDENSYPLLFEMSMAIETQLSEYWRSAYIASKHCNYFLPEFWQPEHGGMKNKFSGKIYDITTGDDNNKYALLNNDLLPEVKVYQENDKTILPKYSFKRQSLQNLASSPVSSATTLSNNPAIISIMQLLDESLNNWQIEEIGTTTYYYSDFGGMTWKDFLREVAADHDAWFSGYYILIYQALRDHYTIHETNEYERYKQERELVLRDLHSQFGFLLLERDYNDPDAMDSLELLQKAKYAFKDYENPEAEYFLTLIKSPELRRINRYIKDNETVEIIPSTAIYGQEIRIGDSIRLRAEEYYNEYDQIYSSLSKYLFITEISYTLRDSANFSVTVNDVRYQDKLIQRLVRLMK